MRLKLTILAAAAAFSLLAADAPIKPDTPPAINTAKLWRLIANAQTLRQQANQTPQAKAADAAEEEIRKEQSALEAKCGPKFTLGYQQDSKAENAGDIICVLKPPPPSDKK